MIDRRAFLASAAALGLGGPALAAADPFAGAVDALKRRVEDSDLPFAALRIARHGQVLAETHLPGVEAIGPDSLYRIYSMTKPVVAAATVLLVEDGRLTLETPVADIVPELADLKAAAGSLDRLEPARPMTVAHLLTHTCGLANSWGGGITAPLYQQAGLVAAAWMYDPDVGGLDGLARRLGALPLEFQPGSDWIYGYGLDIAGLIIERIEGERLGDVLRRRLFDPLGMTATGFFAPLDRAHGLTGLYTGRGVAERRLATGAERALLRCPFADSGSGGLVSTLSDYGRFADMLAGYGRVGDVQVMRPDSARLLMTPYGPQDHIAPALARFGGLGQVGQALGGVTRLADDMGPGSAGEYGWGGAAGTAFWSHPGLGLSVTVMTQLMTPETPAPRTALKPLIYRIVADG